MSERVLVKLGGSVITDKQTPSAARPEVIRRLACEVASAMAARLELRVVLGHGSGSFGHVVAAKYNVQQGIPDDQSWWGYAATSAAAGRLNRIVSDLFLEAGVPVVSVQPSASARCVGGELAEMSMYPVCECLRRGLVPLLYGDVAFDSAQGCTILSTEQVLAYVARRWHPSRIIMVGEVDGVYDSDPMVDVGASLTPRITPESFQSFETRLGGSHGLDVTGGMLTKVREMVALVAEGSTERVNIISGSRQDALRCMLVDGDAGIGTVIEKSMLERT